MNNKHSNIRKIILNTWTNAKILSIEEFSEGYNNVVYDVKLDIGEFVVKIIKFKGHEKYLLKQLSIRTILQKRFKNFPIAKIIKSDYSKKIISDSYIISEKISGKSLQSQYSKVKNKEQLYEEIGELYGKMHSFKLENYGEFDHSLNIIKKYKNWYLLKSKEIKNIFEKIEKDKLLSKKNIDENEYFFEKNKFLLKKEIGPCLCHGDAADTNIIIAKSGRGYHVNGLIDFEFSKSSGAIYELFGGVRSFKNKYKYKNNLVKGYSKWSELPKDWERLALFYFWMKHLKQLTMIKDMKWRDLNNIDTQKRKENLKEKSIFELKKITIK